MQVQSPHHRPVGRRCWCVQPCLPTGHARGAALAASALASSMQRDQLRQDTGTELEVVQASKATPSCLHLMQWPNTPPFTTQRPLQPGEMVSAFLDDTYIVYLLERVATLYGERNRRTSLHHNRIPALPRTYRSGPGPCLQSVMGSWYLVHCSAPKLLLQRQPLWVTCSRPG